MDGTRARVYPHKDETENDEKWPKERLDVHTLHVDGDRWSA